MLFDQFEEFIGEAGIVFADDVSHFEDDSTVIAFSYTELADDKEILKTLIKGQIASRMYDRSMWYPVYRPLDRVLTQSMDLWMAAEKLAHHDVGDN